MTRLVATDAGYSVRQTALVARASLTVQPGELVAIVGPNGAGKSTLLRLLAGDIAPSAGRITIDGQDASAFHPSELSLLRAFLHHPADAIPFTSRQVIALGRHPHRHSPGNTSAHDAAAIDAAMRLTGVEELATRRFTSLSGGEQMRVSIARVLAQDTPVLLLDEPTAPLDVSHRERVLHMLRRQADRGRAVVTVIHDLNAAAGYATRVVLMSHGRIMSDGTPAEVLQPGPLTEAYAHRMQVVGHPLRDGPLVVADAWSDDP